LKFFDSPIIYSNFCRLIRPKTKEFCYFLYLYFQFLYKQDEFFNFENGTSGIKNLDYKTLLKSFPVKIPKDRAVILYFDGLIQPVFLKINANRNQIRTLSTIRDSLLPKLMSGELRVST
jgi:type I restriction enzyme S subunit